MAALVLAHQPCFCFCGQFTNAMAGGGNVWAICSYSYHGHNEADQEKLMKVGW